MLSEHQTEPTVIDDLRKKVKILEKLEAPVYGKDPGGFHH